MGIGGAETARLIASLEFQDKNFMRGLKQIEKGVNRVDRRLGAASGALNRNLARGIDTLVTKGGEFLVGTIKDAADFETAITGVAKTVDGDISGITDELKKMSTQIPLSFVELAGIAELGGAMGIAKQDLVAFTEQVAILAATTDVSAEDAATALGQLGNVIGLTADEYDNFAASLVDLGNQGESTESAILEITKRAGSSAKLFHIAKDETLAWASAVANLGINQEAAGTALGSLFQKSLPLFLKANKTMQKVTGKTAKELKRAFEKDASGALQSLIADLGKLSEGDRLAAIQKLYGKNSTLSKILIAMSDDQDNLTDSLEVGTKAWEEATAAQAEAEIKFKTSESLFKKLDNSVKIVSATVGEALLPVLNDLAEEGIEFLNKPGTQKGIKEFAKGVGEGVRALAGIITSINWGAVAGFLSTAAGFAGQLVTWFTKMPDWAQAFLIGGFAVTKLPVIGSIVSELGKGLIKGVLGMTAGVVNINAGVVNGPGGVPVGGGPKGGPLATLGSIANDFKVAIAGLGLTAAAGLTIAAIAPIALTGLTTAIINATGKPVSQREFEGRVETAVRRGLSPANVPPAGTRVPAQGLQGDWLKDWTRRNSDLEPTMEEVARAAGANKPTTTAGAVLSALARKGFIQRAGTTPLNPPPPVPGRRPGAASPELMKLKVEQQATKNAIENAASISSRENDATKQKVADVAVKTQAAKNAINAAKSINSRENSATKAQVVATKAAVATAGRTTTSAVNINASATRAVAPPIVSTLYAIASQIVSAVYGARPVIQSTNVVNNYSTQQRTGATSGSRNGGYVSIPGGVH